MRSSSFLQLKNILCDYDDQDSLSSESSSLSDYMTHSKSDVPFIHLPKPSTKVFDSSTIGSEKENMIYVNSSFIIKKKNYFSSVKAKRKRASASQIKILQNIFESTAFPSTVLRENLAYELGMTPRAVQIWFQNRRQAVKKVHRY